MSANIYTPGVMGERPFIYTAPDEPVKGSEIPVRWLESPLVQSQIAKMRYYTYQIIDLHSKGSSFTAIGDELGLTRRQMDEQRQSVLTTLAVRNEIHATYKLGAQGLLPSLGKTALAKAGPLNLDLTRTLYYLSQGYGTEGAAERASLKPDTIMSHRSRILELTNGQGKNIAYAVRVKLEQGRLPKKHIWRPGHVDLILGRLLEGQENETDIMAMTPNEKEYMSMLSLGMDEDKIKEELKISSKKIESLRTNSMAKLGAKTMEHAVRRCFETGLFELTEKPLDPNMPRLSNAELATLIHMSEGLGRHEIADILTTSVYTVDSARRRLIKKLKASSMEHAVRLGIEHGLIDISPKLQQD